MRSAERRHYYCRERRLARVRQQVLRRLFVVQAGWLRSFGFTSPE